MRFPTREASLVDPSSERTLFTSSHTGRLLILSMSVAAGRVSAQDWSARFPRDAACDLGWARGIVGQASFAQLTVRAVPHGDDPAVEGIRAVLTPLDQENDSLRIGQAASTGGMVHFDSLRPGRYRLHLYTIGRSHEEDTVSIASGSSDTATAIMVDQLASFFNEYNCRPHHFRSPGQSACIRSGWRVEHELDYLRRTADSARNDELHIPAFTASDVRLVTNERTCRRAGWAYDSTSPPRRVIVLRAGTAYYVSDPAEPLHAGEFEITCFYDRRWRPLGCLAG